MYHIYGKAFHGLDPAKHIYMNKAYQNQMDDYFRLGDFPWVENPPIMVDPTHYYPQIFQIIDEHLKQTHPQNKFLAYASDPETFFNITWPEAGVTNFNAEIPELLLKFSERLIIRESKLSWTKEQRARLQASQFALAWIPH